MQQRIQGISVIICCYNSSKRINKALDALAVQVFKTFLLWEIILVDNASSDNTATKAISYWSLLNTAAELRVVEEPVPGLANARKRGISEAKYEYIVFCDDDNWLFPDYLQGIINIFEGNSKIAACGGMGIPVFETDKPAWFDDYAECYATGSQEITREDGRLLNLYGAGMAIRKSSLDQLAAAKFTPLMAGRVGNKLSSSEDTELTYALVLMGHELYFSSALHFYHYLPAERLQLSYLKKLFTAFGNDGPVRNLYYANISGRFFHRQIINWNVHFLLSIYRMFKYLVVPPKKGGRTIYYQWNTAYIKSLISIRRNYNVLQKNIAGLKGISEKNTFYSIETA